MVQGRFHGIWVPFCLFVFVTRFLGFQVSWFRWLRGWGFRV